MAITNDKQREVTQQALKRFIQARRLLDSAQFESEDVHPLIRKVQMDGFESIIDELRQQILDYDNQQKASDDGMV